MNINRRQFLQILGATGAMAVVPALAKTPEPEHRLSVHLGDIPPGAYVLSYYFKKKGGQWRRHVQVITVEDPMPLDVGVDMKTGDCIAGLQLEWNSSRNGLGCTNVIANSAPDYHKLEGAFTSAEYDSEVMGYAVRAV